MDQVTVCDSAKDVAFKSDIIFSCLNDENSVKFVLFNSRHGVMADSIFAPIIKNKIYVEMTSIPIKLSKQICATVAQNGGLYVEMQFQGSRRDAEQGRLISYYAGHMAGVKKCTPYLSLITTNTVHFWADPVWRYDFKYSYNWLEVFYWLVWPRHSPWPTNVIYRKKISWRYSKRQISPVRI